MTNPQPDPLFLWILYGLAAASIFATPFIIYERVMERLKDKTER